MDPKREKLNSDNQFSLSGKGYLTADGTKKFQSELVRFRDRAAWLKQEKYLGEILLEDTFSLRTPTTNIYPFPFRWYTVQLFYYHQR